MDKNDQLHSIFAALKSRLYELEFSWEKGYISEDVSTYSKDIESQIHQYSPETVLPFLSSLLEKVDSLKSRIPELSEGIRARKWLDIKPDKSNSEIINDETNRDIEWLSEEIKECEIFLRRLNGVMIDDKSSYGTSSQTDRLRFNLTVEQICALLRLFRDNDILPRDINNRQLAESYMGNLESKNGKGSSKDIQNALSPTFEMYDFWAKKFKSLATIASKKSDNGSEARK